MSKKLVGILIVLLGALLFAGFIYFLFFSNRSFTDILAIFKREPTTVAEPVKGPEINTSGNNTPNTIKKIIAGNGSETAGENSGEIEPKSSTQVTRDDLTRMAASFSERFGSYSNQSNFSNIVDLKILMSQRMKQWADGYVREQRDKNLDTSLYFGITTKAIAEEILDLDDHIGQAAVIVNTRRREATGSMNNVSNVFSQDIEVHFIKENGAWKVDRANWQDKITLAD